MKFEVLLIGLLLFGLRGAAQPVDWQKASDWTLYAVHGKDIWQLSVDSLDHFKHATLNGDSTRYLMSNASIMSDKKVPVWMGGFVITCRLDHRMRKLLASSYGGFFYDGESKQWYRVAADRQQEWLDYLAQLATEADSR